MILCFDVGGTFIKHGLFQENGELIKKTKIVTLVDNKENFLNQLAGVICEYEKEYLLSAISFSFPGAIDAKNGITVLSGAIEPLRGEPFVALLKEKLNKDYLVCIENDGNCAALAEKYSGAGVDCDNFVVMTLGTGIGGGIILNSQLYSGNTFLAGEFGMTLFPTEDNGLDIIGKLAATSGLIRLYRKTMNLTDSEEITGEEIFKADTKEKEDVLFAWGNYVAMVIYNLTVMINPKRILVGGGVSKNPKLLSYITKSLPKFPLWEYFGADIDICKHQEDAGLIGAFYLATEQLEVV